MVQCEICLEEYKEGNLELHRQMCEVRLMFRCSLCNGDYVNKEGLWNHLDLHEIADEIKELHYQEIKAKYKLHQCVLCNDQRAYSEISYWKHVHDVHDGFFLRCSDCGENFRSEKLKNDHASSRCKARDPMEEEQVRIEDGNMSADTECLKLSLGDQSSNTIEGPDNRLSIDYANKNNGDKESELPPINLPSRFPCDICGKSLFSKGSRLRHKHTKRYYPDESNLDNIQIGQDTKQVQNIDPKMEITVEETTTQGLSSVNPSSDVLDSRSNKHSLAYLSEDEIKDSQVIDNESQTVSVAPLNCYSKKQVVSEEISQPPDENLSNQSYFCNICGITMHKYSQFRHHRATKHKEGRHQCPLCSRKFHYKSRLEEHVSRCASFKHTCELCGQKFNLRSRVEDHKKSVHHGSRPLRDANIEGADCTGAKKKDSVEKIDAAEEMTSCMVCRILFASTDELMKHKLNCPKHGDSQFRTEDISLLHGVSEVQADSTIVAQGEIIDVKLEIEVEETLLQEQDFQVSSQNLERSSAATLTGAEVIRPTNPPENMPVSAQIDSGYAPVKTCAIDDAKSFVKNFEFGFCYRSEKICKKAKMQYYRCSRVKQGARPQCERKVLICTPYTNEESTVCAKGEHSCMNAPPGNLTSAPIGFGYAPIKTCSFEDAKSFVKNFEFGFAIRVENCHEKGNFRYYRCSRIKQKVRRQCKRKVLIFTPDTNEESTVCVKGEHSCINAAPKNMPVPTQIDIDYAPVKTCSIEDAKSFVKNFEFGFCHRSEKIGKKAKMQYYRCSRVKQGARPQCERKVLICTPYTNEESTVCAKGEHSCMHTPPENLTSAPIGFGYAPVKTCSFEDAKSFVKNFEFGFAILVENCHEKGYFRYYRCSRIKQRARPQCKRKVLIFTPDKNEESTVCAKGEHSCSNAPPENLICQKSKPSVEHH